MTKVLTSIAALLSCVSMAFAARPVARWDVVPDQLIDSSFKVGVVAFHIDGVKVEFRVNNTLVATALNPTYNDRTDVWEYWFALNPSSYSDGSLTIDARAICLSGDSTNDPDYDLDSITLYANSNGTLGSAVEKWVDSVNGSDSNDGSESSPYATLATGVTNTPAGGTVYLQAGSYSPAGLGGGSSRLYWTTICPAENVSRSSVIIGTGRPSTQRLKWQNVSFQTTYTGTYGSFLVGENGNHSVWLDDCYFENLAGRWNGFMNYFSNNYVPYTTGGGSSNMANGPRGVLTRDHVIEELLSDAWSGGDQLVVNCAVYDMDAGTSGAHADFHQSNPGTGYVEDSILYNVIGLDCACQGLFGSGLINSAFVNILIERTSDAVGYSQYDGTMENVLFAHISLVRQAWLWRGSDDNAYDPTDVNMVNCLFNNMAYYEDATPQAGLIMNYNHFNGSNYFGSNYTTGDMLYVDITNQDFHISSSSPAAGNGLYLQCVPADVDGDPYDSSGRNRGCYGSGNIAPVADAGADQSSMDNDGDGYETFSVDGSSSSDSDGSIVSYVWTEGSTQLATGSTANISFGTGEHTVTLTVTDDGGKTDSDTLTITLTAAPASGTEIYVDLSDDFNIDAWCGPEEHNECISTNSDLGDLFGGLEDGNGNFILSQNSYMICASSTMDYNGTYITDGQGSNEDGFISGTDYDYYIAGTDCDDVYSGDITEVADPSTYDTQPNAIFVGSLHNKNTFQIGSVTIELDESEKCVCQSVNFVLAAANMADKARNMRIVALYGSTGSISEVLYSFSTADGGSGPLMTDTSGGTDFTSIMPMTQYYAASVGSTGTINSLNTNLWEFSTPLELDDSSVLWGFRIEDVDPTLNWNARGLTIFGCTIETAQAASQSTSGDLEGDIDGNGSVDIYDFLILKGNYGVTGNATRSMGDLTDDGTVDISDFLILKANYSD